MIVAVKPEEPVRQPSPEVRKEIHIVRLAERPARRRRQPYDPEENIPAMLFTRRRRFQPSPEEEMLVPSFARLASAAYRKENQRPYSSFPFHLSTVWVLDRVTDFLGKATLVSRPQEPGKDPKRRDERTLRLPPWTKFHNP
jgi:hypothetical protein